MKKKEEKQLERERLRHDHGRSHVFCGVVSINRRSVKYNCRIHSQINCVPARAMNFELLQRRNTCVENSNNENEHCKLYASTATTTARRKPFYIIHLCNCVFAIRQEN